MAESLEAEIRQLYEDWIANPSPVVCARLADRLRIAGRNDEALEVSRRGQKDWPGNNSIRMVIARCLRGTGDMQEARSAFEEVLKTDPFNLVALKNLAEMSMVEGRYRDAVKLFGDYVFENPGDPEAQQQLEEAKRKERTAPEPAPVPSGEEAVAPPEAVAVPSAIPAAASGPVVAEPAVTLEQAFAAEPESPPVQTASPVEDAFAAESPAGAGSEPPSPEPASAPEPAVTVEQAFPAETEPPPGQAEADIPAAPLRSEAGAPGRDAEPVPARAAEPASAPEPETAPPTEPAASTAPAPEASSQPGQAVSGEEAAPAPFPQTGRMERILRSQGMAVPEARPAAPSPAPAHAPEPRAAQGLKREPRSLFDLFSPEERAELFLEPYRQEEK
ncbi:MAG: tetratricopeptide repeat protein [Candidatus Fermentibacter sp.]|nr:tetratricopeptide repeat protein [Candidatus Fermentibacter sp.]